MSKRVRSHGKVTQLRKRALAELGLPRELADMLVDFTAPRLELDVEVPPRSRSVTLPAPKLLDPLPDETAAEYAARMRREWRRETSPRRRSRSSSVSEEQMIEDTYAILGVR